MQYNFFIHNDKLIFNDHVTPRTGSVNVYECVFNINESVKGLQWFCVFNTKGINAIVTPIINNKCFIPVEVLKDENDIDIGCYATNGNTEDFKRINTNWLTFRPTKGAYMEGEAPETPSPDLWETLIFKTVPYIGSNGNWFIYDMESGQYKDTGKPSTGTGGGVSVDLSNYYDKNKTDELLDEKVNKSDLSIVFDVAKEDIVHPVNSLLYRGLFVDYYNYETMKYDTNELGNYYPVDSIDALLAERDAEIEALKKSGGGSVDLSEYEKLHGKIGVINAYNSVPILIDTTNKTITIKGNTSTFLVSTSGQNIQIASVLTIGMKYQTGAVVYNLTSGAFEVRPNNAAGGLKTDDILIMTYNQHGKFVNCPSMHSIDNNLYGIDLQPEYEMLSPTYEFIELPTVGFWSDFCFVNNKLLIFVASGDEEHVKQNGKIVIINPETWQIEKILLHDFGHCNTVDYNSEADTLLIGNLPGNTQYQGALYIFYDVSNWVDFENNHLLLFNELSPTIVDLQSLNTTYKGKLLGGNIDNVVACWGGSNHGQNNVVYANSQYNRDWFKLLLGKGSNNLGNGTFTEAEENKFNGTFAALWHDKFSITYEIGQEVTQGIIFDNGKICTSNGHNDIQFFDWSITNKGLTRCEYHDSIYNADASNKFCVSEGYTEKDGYRYVGCIFTTDENRNKATGEYGILKIKKE